jgi:hypothetical protein
MSAAERNMGMEATSHSPNLEESGMIQVAQEINRLVQICLNAEEHVVIDI